MYTAKAATGFGRTDWVITGPCHCDADEDCSRCDGHRRVVLEQNLSQGTARLLASIWNHNEKRTPFNPPRIRGV